MFNKLKSHFWICKWCSAIHRTLFKPRGTKECDECGCETYIGDE
jgi:hypothetical protein